MAKQAVSANDLETAAAELQWVLDSNVEQPLILLSRTRLARVQLAQQAFDAALNTASDADSGAFKSAFAEIRGDVLLAKAAAQSESGVDGAATAAARAAYQVALDNLQQEEASRGGLLQMKINNLQPAPVVTVADAAEAPVVTSDAAMNDKGEG
jgi:predicted negative regulator of RcsB-dependent stress response